MDVGLDFVTPAAGANLGEAIIKQTGWFTAFSSGTGRWMISAEGTGWFSVARTAPVEVTATRIGTRAAQVAELEAANAAKTMSKLSIRNDIALSGGRSGQLVKTLTSPANSVVKV